MANTDDYEAVLAMSPAYEAYYYGLRGQGTFKGPLSADLADCPLLKLAAPPNRVMVGSRLAALKPVLSDRYEVISISEDYSPEVRVPTINGILTGELAGVVLAMGQLIDGAALAFLAREAGYIVTTLTGEPLPPLSSCQNYRIPGLIMAATPELHQDLVAAAEQI